MISLYRFGILILTLLTAAGLIQSIIHLWLDNQIFGLESLDEWFLVLIIVSTLSGLVVLKYYQAKTYRVAFIVGTIATIASLYQLVVTYYIIHARELQTHFIPAFFVSGAIGLLYSFTLIFSNTGKRPWLKITGISFLILGVIVLSIFLWSMNTVDVETKVIAQKIQQWAALLNSICPLFFIMNFRDEIKTLKKQDATLAHKYETLVSAFGMVAVVATLVLGGMLFQQGYTALYWQKRNFEKAQQMAQQFEARTFVGTSGDTLLYRLLKPLDYDPQKKYPLIVCLHHGGAHGRDNITQMGADPAPLLANDMHRRSYPAFLFVPQCPQGSGWGGIPNYPTVDSLVFQTIDTLEKEFPIDVTRRYVLGISGGGYGSWHFICARPNMFAAAIPICGGTDPLLAKKIVDVPVWAFHGEKDNLVPVRFSREMVAAVKQAGGDPKYTEFSGSGHNIWNEVSATPGLWEWLFAQKRR